MNFALFLYLIAFMKLALSLFTTAYYFSLKINATDDLKYWFSIYKELNKIELHCGDCTKIEGRKQSMLNNKKEDPLDIWRRAQKNDFPDPGFLLTLPSAFIKAWPSFLQSHWETVWREFMDVNVHLQCRVHCQESHYVLIYFEGSAQSWPWLSRVFPELITQWDSVWFILGSVGECSGELHLLSIISIAFYMKLARLAICLN